MREAQELLVGRFAGAETVEEAALQQELLARLARRSGFGRTFGGSFVLQEPLQDVDGRRE